MNPNTMTLDEVRDELARMDGWKWDQSFVWHCTGRGAWVKRGAPGDDTQTIVWTIVHPHPATLDGAAAALPEGWKWEMFMGKWHGYTHVGVLMRTVTTPVTDNECLDRYRLALACRLAETTNAREGKEAT